MVSPTCLKRNTGTDAGRYNVLKHSGALRKWIKCLRISRRTALRFRPTEDVMSIEKSAHTHTTALKTNTKAEKRSIRSNSNLAEYK